MDLESALNGIARGFDAASIRYALIGGLAMALRGVQRSTIDGDFIIALEDIPRAHEILKALGFHRDFHSDNLSHYVSPPPGSVRIDLLHAFRAPTLGMLKRADRIHLNPSVLLPVVHPEDIIGLKIQAAVNDPTRARSDWNDIHALIEHAAAQNHLPDWQLITDYLSIFNLESKLQELQQTYHNQIEHRKKQ